jgi:hypothetical protein
VRFVSRLGLWLIGLLVFGFMLLLVLGAWYRHEAAAHPITKNELQAARERAVQWLVDHEGAVLDDPNSALWLMVKTSAELTGDSRLARLTTRYMEQWMPPGADTKGWRRTMQADSHEAVDLQDLQGRQPYQQFLMYGLTCDQGLKQWPSVREHLAGRACPMPLLWALKDSACTSHQMLGLRYVKERGCHQTSNAVDATIHQTRDELKQLLWVDFRVRDVYIQRALSLCWGGFSADVDPRALTRIVRAQMSDGGWSDNHVLLNAEHFYLAMGGKHGLTMEVAPSDFHVTAQALLLIDFALRDWPGRAPALAKNNAP